MDDGRQHTGALSVLIMDDISFDSQAFRRALGRFATGVTIVTARAGDGTAVGLSCNSFASLSLDPPLVLWSVANNSRNYAALCAAAHFAVHVLDTTQAELCLLFASRDRDRFAGLDLEAGLHDLPLLKQYHARFECATYAHYEGGDHTIIVGRLLRLCEQDGAPLIFHRGAFGALAGSV